MTQTICFASSKGGVGKSTTCASVACAYAGAGESVMVLDLDQNETLNKWSKKLPFPGVTVEACPTDKLSDAIAAANGKYDRLLLDLAGFRDVAIMLAFAKSNLVVIPSGTSVPDLMQAAQMVKDLADVSNTLGREIPYRLLFTRVLTLRSRVADHVMGLAETQKIKRFDGVMHERAAYKEIFLTPTVPTGADGDHKAGAEVRALLAEIEEITNGRRSRATVAA